MTKFDWTGRKHVVIDLGTNVTRVYVEGSGMIFNESSIIAINTKNKSVYAIGNEAKKMVGKLNKYIKTYPLLSNGALTNIKLIFDYLKVIFKNHMEHIKKSYATIAFPSNLNQVEKDSLVKAIKTLGFFFVDAQESIKLGLYGATNNDENKQDKILVDMGAGKVDCAIISGNDIIVSKQLKIGGNDIDQLIIKELRSKNEIAIGEQTAEKIKLSIASVIKTKKNLSLKIYGYNLMTAMPIEMEVKEDDIREIIKNFVLQVSNLIASVIESSTSDLAEEIIKNGILFFGGLSSIIGLKVYLEDFFEIPVAVAKNPANSIIDGGIIYKTKTRKSYEEKISKNKRDDLFII